MHQSSTSTTTGVGGGLVQHDKSTCSKCFDESDDQEQTRSSSSSSSSLSFMPLMHNPLPNEENDRDNDDCNENHQRSEPCDGSFSSSSSSLSQYCSNDFVSRKTDATLLPRHKKRRKYRGFIFSSSLSLKSSMLLLLIIFSAVATAFQTTLFRPPSARTTYISLSAASSSSSSSSSNGGDGNSRTTSTASRQRQRQRQRRRSTTPKQRSSTISTTAKSSSPGRVTSSSSSSEPQQQQQQRPRQQRHQPPRKSKKPNKKSIFSIQQHTTLFPQHAALFDTLQKLKGHVYQNLAGTKDNNNNNDGGGGGDSGGNDVRRLSDALDIIRNDMMPLLKNLDTFNYKEGERVNGLNGVINGEGTVAINGDTSNMTATSSSSSSSAAANEAARVGISVIIDETLRLVYDRAFIPPYDFNSSFLRAKIGANALYLQLSSSSEMVEPYNSVTRSTLLHALRAFTSVKDGKGNNNNSHVIVDGEEKMFQPTLEAYRLLQRLITGIGVRYSPRIPSSPSSSVNGDTTATTGLSKMPVLDERDFNMVLNAYIHHNNDMNRAHRIIALQERLHHAPPLSAVPYSIMLKGYGRLGDVHNVDMILSHAESNGVEPDTVMINSQIDAYVNCGRVEDALSTFRQMKKKNEIDDDTAKPNVRTYNTILKGLAKTGDLLEALRVSEEMANNDIWDDVTTNSLVNAAVSAHEFEIAEKILTEYTNRRPSLSRRRQQKRRRKVHHPNVEAYTELLDGYAKAGMLEKALSTLQQMKKRNVAPNEYTYTCMVGALARANRIPQAKKMIKYMRESDENAMPITATYNALITGMLIHDEKEVVNGNDHNKNKDGKEEEEEEEESHKAKLAFYDSRVKEALSFLGEMIHSHVPPNAITASALVDALGRCQPSHVAEAKELIEQLDEAGYVPSNNVRVSTALIRTCAAGNDIVGCEEAFLRMAKPDVVALNAFLDACTRCDDLRLAFKMFGLYVRGTIDERREGLVKGTAGSSEVEIGANERWKITPDVITYSVLISALLKIKSATAAKRAQSLYNEMKREWDIMPDKGLVDIILTAMVDGGSMGLEQSDIEFTLAVLRDAEKLDWEPGQLKKRKKVVRGVLVGRMSEVWKEDENAYGMDTEVDPLFQKKGWNKVDSGFRLWGGGTGENLQQSSSKNQKGEVDEFLESKGWNDLDSGFRIL